jgi:hypothetical protein
MISMQNVLLNYLLKNNKSTSVFCSLEHSHFRSKCHMLLLNKKSSVGGVVVVVVVTAVAVAVAVAVVGFLPLSDAISRKPAKLI